MVFQQKSSLFVSRKKIKKKKKTCLPVAVLECFRCYFFASPFLLVFLLQEDKLSTKFFTLFIGQSFISRAFIE